MSKSSQCRSGPEAPKKMTTAFAISTHPSRWWGGHFLCRDPPLDIYDSHDERYPRSQMKARHSLPTEPAYDELVGLVRNLPRGRIGQIVNGKLHVSTSCDAAHAHTLAELSATLLAGSPLGDPVPTGWTFLTEVELLLPAETLVVADIAGWRIPHDRLAALPSPIGVVPQWVCEVLDPSTRVLDLTHKRHHYALSGISNLWIVDPVARVLEVY